MFGKTLVCNGDALFATDFAKLLHGAAYRFSIACDAKEMLADDPARNAHDFRDFLLGIAVFEIQDRCFKLFLCK